MGIGKDLKGGLTRAPGRKPGCPRNKAEDHRLLLQMAGHIFVYYFWEWGRMHMAFHGMLQATCRSLEVDGKRLLPFP